MKIIGLCLLIMFLSAVLWGQILEMHAMGVETWLLAQQINFEMRANRRLLLGVLKLP